ncbi:hypothetical protein [Streptomyces atratus]|uniref:hypothetical protein n=1 Tax=Streptomyces atratus TaxID=1893 RepID=UPI0036669FA9
MFHRLPHGGRGGLPPESGVTDQPSGTVAARSTSSRVRANALASGRPKSPSQLNDGERHPNDPCDFAKDGQQGAFFPFLNVTYNGRGAPHPQGKKADRER